MLLLLHHHENEIKIVVNSKSWLKPEPLMGR